MISISSFILLIFNLGLVSLQLTSKAENSKNLTEASTNTVVESAQTAVLDLETRQNSKSTTMQGALVDTATAKTALAFQVPEDTYYVQENGKICILLTLDAKFSFGYTNNGQKPESPTTDMALPDDLEDFGSCGNGNKLPEITLSIPALNLTFIFDKSKKGNNWVVKTIQLVANMSDSLQFSNSRSFVATSKGSELNIEAPINMSFTCAKPNKVKLYDEKDNVIAYAVLDNIKIQAYVNSDGPFGTEYPCQKTQKEIEEEESEIIYPSDTVPIAVGSTLAVVTIIIIAAYGIYRSLFVKKMDYDTMED